ncbi:MAG: DUF885 domain-containing protein, partial [Planctomycetales bacterium]|nr:DUF885 domain-containing protein [Planctomycetales bacterium]
MQPLISRNSIIGGCAAALAFIVASAAVADDGGTGTLNALLEEMWEYDLRESPQFATHVGDARYNDRLGEVDVEAVKRRHDAGQKFLERLKAIDREGLALDDQINYDVVERRLRDDEEEYRFGAHLAPITSRSGFHIEFPDLRREVPLNNLEDYENYLARLRDFDRYANEHIELMREGLRLDVTLPSVALRGFEPAIQTHLVDNPERTLWYEPFAHIPSTIPESERERLREDARQAISTFVIPAYARFGDFLGDEYAPRARGSIGASALPHGRDFYRHRVRRFTTLDVSPEEVHQIGLQEVARIREEMQAIITRVEFEGDFAAFLEHLRSDSKFYAGTKQELLNEASFILKQMDGKLPELFGRLPRLSYGLREIPDFIAPRTSSAYYMPGAGDGSRAGFFCLNTYNLKSRPRYTLEALSFHEAVPGHHLQIALQHELADLPPIRRFSSFTAFVEGWALYAERLGIEAGFYQDPYSDFGRLTMEIWRACRLVVDTGIHYMGWTRSQAIDYLKENTALSVHDIEAEVDRYISWPG